MARLEEAAVKRKPHRAMDASVVVTPLVDTVMHLPVDVDTRPYMEELWELEVGVPEQPLPEGPKAEAEDGGA
jgi:hypothetical protein